MVLHVFFGHTTVFGLRAWPLLYFEHSQKLLPGSPLVEKYTQGLWIGIVQHCTWSIGKKASRPNISLKGVNPVEL
jgi:hypothetical protein